MTLTANRRGVRAKSAPSLRRAPAAAAGQLPEMMRAAAAATAASESEAEAEAEAEGPASGDGAAR